jgi:hypothetical protein
MKAGLIKIGLMTGFVLALSAQAAEKTMILKDQLNRAWTNELVSYAFEAPKGACAAGSIALKGPNGPVPVQLSEVQAWPNTTFVKSARLSFVVPLLEPLASQSYAISYGKEAVPAVASDLKIAAEKDRVEITTGRCGLRLPLGEKTYDQPVPLKELSGPFQAMKLGGSGVWAGASRLAGDATAKSWSAVLAESGPVFARVLLTYKLADDSVATLAAMVVAGDNAIRWDMAVTGDRPEQALEFSLPPIPGVKQAVSLKGYGQWSRADRTAPLAPGEKPFSWLSPNTSLANIFQEGSWSMKLAVEGGREMRISSRDPAAWADPVAPMTYGGYPSWNLEMVDLSWQNWKRKRIPMTYAADGTVTLQASLVKGARRWSVSDGAPVVGDRLNWVKDMVLDWPADPRSPHPRLFVDKAAIEDAWTRAASEPELAKVVGNGTDANGIVNLLRKPADQRTPAAVDAALKSVRDFLALEGDFDVMRSAVRTASMYDAAVDSGLLSAQERAVFRARMAFLAYQMADPQTWDIERGYHSGNPNMSCSYILSLGVAAAALRDHPMAKTWADLASRWEDKWLTDEVGPNGEWIPEGSHYGYVSLDPLVVYAIAAQRAGFRDFTNDPRLKKLLLYFAKTQTPRDPQRGNTRATGAWGRGTSGDKNAIFGTAARMTAKSDPAFSQAMQWIWAETGYPPFLGDGRLGGFEPYYLDRRLPAQAPAWTTDLFPNLGVFFRSAFNTPNESFLIFLSHTDSHRNLDIWTPGIGGFSQWFGRGKPLSTCFNMDTGYNVRHELLRDGVRLARNWGQPGDPKGPFGHYTKVEPQAAFLGGADYVRCVMTYTTVDDRDWFPAIIPPAFPRVKAATGTNLVWNRQALFLKDPKPEGPAYLVVRDTTRGGEPTAWQFWTLSDKIGTPEQAQNVEAFLADKPGMTNMPARELPAGNRYTAVGQFDMDIEYFIASPGKTPRHTLRYGGRDNSRVPEYQDLLHLQLEDDGVYYVAIFPRPRAEAAPAFSTLADGKIIKVSGAFGTDFAFLADSATQAAAEGASFSGTAGSVQQRGADAVLTLGASGETRWNKIGLAAPFAASLRLAGDALTVSLPENGPGGEVTITAPGGWALKQKAAGVKLDSQDGTVRLTVPSGKLDIQLGKK